jgi:hypothetical protein
MDSDYVQQVRCKLQRRLKRVNVASLTTFPWIWAQVWGFLQGNEITKGILDDLENRFPKGEQAAEEFLADKVTALRKGGATELDDVALCYWVLKKYAGSARFDLVTVAAGLGGRDAHSIGTVFRQRFVEPLFDYIEEQIDDKRMTLALLKKYKHRCEWFQRKELLAQCTADTQRGEKLLLYNLYEYLHDQGIEFHIEPESASGRVDLISAQSGKDRLMADAKIFNPDGGQNVSYLGKGFRQLYDYAKTYHEPFGFLVIFKTCEHDLSIQTPHQEQAIPFVTHNNKTIFLLVIDLFEYAEPASKRGKLKSHEVTPQQLIEFITRESGDISQSIVADRLE